MNRRAIGIVSLSLSAMTVITATSALANPARIIELEGRVRLRRDGWSSYHQTSQGTDLYDGDLLWRDRNARAVVLCPNERRWIVPSGQHSVSNYCSELRRFRPIIGIGNLQGGSNPEIPYIITPRIDLISNSTPVLRWNAVSGANRYTVQLIADNQIVWEIQTEQTEIPYPANQTPLEQGVIYSLVVETDTGRSSSEENIADLGFNVFNSNTVQTQVEEIEALELPNEAKTVILVSDVYIPNELTAEAIATLESLVEQNSQSPLVYRLLGDLYLRSGLQLLAQERYQQAADLAQIAQNLEERVDAQFGLGILNSRIGNIAEATLWFSQAQVGAIYLGDENRLEQIETELDNL
ncbi:tetratricopeptide repeat protein [Leptolyngbya sp. FACHB-541]|uniref:tetratricopeptide repeat protein n=1 Tax=Leptolyngbya sp. FACHB-541 TaxID=2692810 RepID=UPI0016827A36|nr:tetratricopeptide repeat protein [Leptolyngbya sp. FACHB-541]MBD2001430.1 tetratricopeptide repeat protein [Leptolyngbya sp. FACHB-541]